MRTAHAAFFLAVLADDVLALPTTIASHRRSQQSFVLTRMSRSRSRTGSLQFAARLPEARIECILDGYE
jgi:hypothetical protein